MNIEELAFKNYYELINIQKIDLLLIIEFLQKDRKEWINQFTQTHNLSVDIQKENQELKKQLEELQKEYEEFQEKASDIQFELKDDRDNYYERLQDKYREQKEFIKWLEYYIKLFDKKDIYEEGSCDTIEEILQKYRSIIGDDK